jgi:hypothetical protein
MEVYKSTLKVTDVALGEIRHKLADSVLENPVPGLVWGKWDNEETDTWHIGFYELKNATLGKFLEASGITFYLLQYWMAEELEGKVVDIRDKKIVIEPARKLD